MVRLLSCIIMCRGRRPGNKPAGSLVVNSYTVRIIIPKTCSDKCQMNLQVDLTWSDIHSHLNVTINSSLIIIRLVIATCWILTGVECQWNNCNMNKYNSLLSNDFHIWWYCLISKLPIADCYNLPCYMNEMARLVNWFILSHFCVCKYTVAITAVHVTRSIYTCMSCPCMHVCLITCTST